MKNKNIPTLLSLAVMSMIVVLNLPAQNVASVSGPAGSAVMPPANPAPTPPGKIVPPGPTVPPGQIIPPGQPVIPGQPNPSQPVPTPPVVPSQPVTNAPSMSSPNNPP